MWQAWTELSEANMNHFNEHPTAHNVVIGVCGVAAVVVMSKMFLKLVKSELDKSPVE